MTLALYMDHHVPAPVTSALRQRGIDCLTALEDRHDQADDEVILQRVTVLARVLFTQDDDFLTIAHNWQTEGQAFTGVISGPQTALTIGKTVSDLELIAKVYDPPDMHNRVEFIPYP